MQPRLRSHRDPVRFGSGIDFGSDGNVLVEVLDAHGAPVSMLIWFRGFRAPASGVRGFGHVYVPARLEIRTDNGYGSIDLQSGGRLSRSGILSHEDVIDRHFGSGTAGQIDLRRTLVITDG